MDYSYWSGEIQGMQEILTEEFPKESTFRHALLLLAINVRIRREFAYLRSKGMIYGDLPPFDTRLIRNLFAGMKNSSKLTLKNILRRTTFEKPY